GFHTDDASSGSTAAARFCDAKEATLAAGTQNDDDVTMPDETRYLGCRTRNVERGEHDPLGNVARELRIGAAREEDCLAFDVELRECAPHGDDAIDSKGCQ